MIRLTPLMSLKTSVVVGTVIVIAGGLRWRAWQTKRQARLDWRVLRTLVTCAPISDTLRLQSFLSRKPGIPAVSSRRTRAAIRRLSKAGYVEITKRRWGAELEIRLTDAGRRTALPKHS